MPLRKRTLRKMTPEARKLAKLIGELESITTRLRNFLPTVQDMELSAIGERKRQEHYGKDKGRGS